MAGILYFVAGFFCLRPITWILGKIITNKKILGFLLELIYLGLAILYFLIAYAGINMLRVGNTGAEDLTLPAIASAVLGILGTLSLGYGIMKYHKTDEDMSEYQDDGYEGTYDRYSNTLYVKEKTKETLSAYGFLAVLTAPLQIVIRSINFLLMFICFFNDDYVCDLAYGYHPDLDGILKTIFVDIVDICRM